jgi:hypothetical protein
LERVGEILNETELYPMRVWQERPIEIAHLSIRPFCALLLAAGILGFSEQDENGMPYPFSFIGGLSATRESPFTA